jgi:hypothetical protein
MTRGPSEREDGTIAVMTIGFLLVLGLLAVRAAPSATLSSC